MKKKIVIDVATIYAGQGGAGGGIWSYAKNLLLHLDEHLEKEDMEIICLVNRQFDLPLKNLKKKELKYSFKKFLIRFFYTKHLFANICLSSKRNSS